MLLTIDIGNTQTVLGLFDGDQLRDTWRLASDPKRTTDELRAAVTQLFYEATKKHPQALAIDKVIIASVVPALTHTWSDLASNLAADLSYLTPNCQQLIVDGAITAQLSAGLANPAEVGADRIANAVAVRHFYGAPAIVIDFGTATNIDIIDTQGNYIGGIISPGIQTSANALFESAARLPHVDLEVPPQVLGTTTKTAVQSGLLHGEAAKITALIDSLMGEQPVLQHPDTPIVATGGLASLIAPLIKQLTAQDEHLTLKGLQLIAAQQFDQGQSQPPQTGKAPA